LTFLQKECNSGLCTAAVAKRACLKFVVIFIDSHHQQDLRSHFYCLRHAQSNLFN
jgi:hypothetical protein